MSHTLKRRKRDKDGMPVFYYEADCECWACSIERAQEDSWCRLAIQRLGDRHKGARDSGTDQERIKYLRHSLGVALLRYDASDEVMQ